MKKKFVVISIIALLIIAAGLFFYFRANGKNAAYKTEKISRGEIKSEVTATGTVKTAPIKKATKAASRTATSHWVGPLEG